MDEQTSRPRRRKKSQLQLFKENQLPLIIMGAAAVLILIFMIGSIVNAVKRNQLDRAAQQAAAEEKRQEMIQLDNKVEALLKDAAAAASQYDYAKAISLLETVAEHSDEYPELEEKLTQYRQAAQSLVAWEDPSQVANLSFQMLIADTQLAFHHAEYGSAFNRNYVTTEEFAAMLLQLYNNGYVLVNVSDLYTTEVTDSGATAYKANTLYLPEGKKPLIITQTNVNYNYYLVDSDNDMLPDKDGCGFANKLLIKDGKPVNEMVDRNGQTVQGDYDLIPILESFLQSYPDFSYRGAKAVVALTGYDGLFGYRTAPKDQERLGDAYTEQINQAIQVAQWLQDNGYELACYTYRNIGYGVESLANIQTDLEKWNQEVAPLLGHLDMLVFAQRSDISGEGTYSGAKYEILKSQGFKFYLGFAEDGDPWSTVTDSYVRQGRIMVSGATMTHHSGWFSGMFDPQAVLDQSRGDVPAW